MYQSSRTRIMRDYVCSRCGFVHERLSRAETTGCPECGHYTAKSVIGAPHIAYMRMGVDPVGCPTAADKWAKAHESVRPSSDG